MGEAAATMQTIVEMAVSALEDPQKSMVRRIKELRDGAESLEKSSRKFEV